MQNMMEEECPRMNVGSEGGRKDVWWRDEKERNGGTASMLSFATESNFRHVHSIPFPSRTDSQERRGVSVGGLPTNLTLVVTVCYGRENKSFSLSLPPFLGRHSFWKGAPSTDTDCIVVLIPIPFPTDMSKKSKDRLRDPAL